MQVTSEGSTKITKSTIDAAWRRRRPDHRLIVRDKDCRGLALIVNATSMAWCYAYRPRGTDPATGQRWPNRTVTIGNPATHSVDAARIEANSLKGKAAAGRDPAAENKAAAESARRKRSGTLGRLAVDYAKVLPTRQKMRGDGLPSPRYVSDELAQVRLALADLEGLPAAELGPAHVRSVIDATADKTATARARFGALSRFLDWCQDAGHIPANPCALIARARRPRAPQARAHYLSLRELARLWNAAGACASLSGVTLPGSSSWCPCRRNEAARLDWSHLDLAAAEWRQPAHMTKNRDPHRLHLMRWRWTILRVRQKATGGKGLVFPAPKSGAVVDTFTDIKAALTDATKQADGEAGGALVGWTWHDFRRSFATALGEAGIPEAVADAVLNHRQSATRGGVLGVYQRASRWPEQVKAMELWGRLLDAAIEGSDAEGRVMPIAARAG